MFDEIVKSVRSYMYEKSSSPLAGSFVVSWLAWNYKFILLVFSSETVLEKYRIIDDVLYVTNYQVFGVASSFPLITALAYIFLYPFPALKVFEFSKKRQGLLNKAKQDIENERLITIKEKNRLIEESHKLEDGLLKEIERKDAELRRYKDEKDTSVTFERIEDEPKEKIIKTKVNLSNTNLPLSSISVAILNLAEKRDAKFTGLDVSDHIPEEKKTVITYNIDKLYENGYIEPAAGTDDQGNIYYSLSKKGRAYLVENELLT